MLGRKSRRKPSGMSSVALFYMPRGTQEAGLFAEDSKGYIFAEILKRLAASAGQAVPRQVLKQPDQTINSLVRNNGLVIFLRDHEGNKSVYSANYRNKLPAAFANRIRGWEVYPDDEILWSSDVFTTPRRGSAREVIWGEKLEGPPKPTKAQIAPGRRRTRRSTRA